MFSIMEHGLAHEKFIYERPLKILREYSL